MVSSETSSNMLTCEMCSESISYGDDYVSHLQVVHNIVKNYNFFLQKANEQLKGGQKRKADVITLEDDEEALSKDEEHEDFSLDPKVKEEIEAVVEKTMNELLDPIKKLIDGKVPLGEESLTAEDLARDPFKADEKIWESFNQLKEIINNLEFPEELISSLTNSQKESEGNQKSKPLKSTSQFKLPTAVDQENQQNKRRATESPSPSSKAKPQTGKTISKITPQKASSIPDSNKGMAAQSANSSISPRSNESSTPGKTMYCCPLEGCSFSTSKDGMRTGDAAQHLKKDHQVTKQKMSDAPSGFYKFNKVKSEGRK